MTLKLEKLKNVLSGFSKNYSRHVLNMAMANSSGIYCTDLETTVLIKNNYSLESGLYSIDCLGPYCKKLESDIDDYPYYVADLFKDFKKIEKTTISTKLLESLLKHASDDATRIFLNSICFDKNSIVATNGYHLKHVDNLENFENTYILPREAVKHLLKLLKAYKIESVLIEFNEEYFKIDSENFTMVGRLIYRDYLKWNAVIPKKTSKKFTLDFLPDLKTIKPHLDKRKNLVTLKSENNEVFYCVYGTDIKIKVGSSDHDFEVGFNAYYLNICIENNKNVLIKYNNELSPFVINENVILMPMKL